MSDYVLFQMWGPFRQSLIAGHLFYVEQARRRLLSQFGDIEAEADKAAEDWLRRSSGRFDPDRHDPATSTKLLTTPESSSIPFSVTCGTRRV